MKVKVSVCCWGLYYSVCPHTDIVLYQKVCLVSKITIKHQLQCNSNKEKLGLWTFSTGPPPSLNCAVEAFEWLKERNSPHTRKWTLATCMKNRDPNYQSTRPIHYKPSILWPINWDWFSDLKRTGLNVLTTVLQGH